MKRHTANALRRSCCLSLIIMLFVLSACDRNAQDDSIFETLTGKWSFEEYDVTCATGGIRITFNADQSRMIQHYGTPVQAYDGEMITQSTHTIISVTDRVLHYRSDGETRLFNGSPITWLLVMERTDAFYWEIPEAKRAYPDTPSYWRFGPVKRCVDGG